MAFEPPEQLTCYEFLERLSGGVSQPPLVIAGASEDDRKKVVIKVRQPDCGAENNQGATSLACEFVVSAIGKGLGLPVPDFFVVDIPFSLALAIPDDQIAALFSQNSGPNFGCEYVPGFAEWNSNILGVKPSFRELLGFVLAFDSLVVNCDRRVEKPNLLYRGDEIL